LIRRIEGIKKRDAKAIENLVYKEKYTKFDDWPPFDLQGSEGLRNEAQALRLLKEYDYETKAWNIEVFGDSALATFTIRYRGRIRDLSFNVQSRVTAFLMKREGEWKIVHEHWSRFPQEQPTPKASDRGKSMFPNQRRLDCSLLLFVLWILSGCRYGRRGCSHGPTYPRDHNKEEIDNEHDGDDQSPVADRSS